MSYPPQQGSYPPQGGYPPQGNYPPQQSYPPHQSYPPQQNYPPQASYPPQQSYPPQGGKQEYGKNSGYQAPPGYGSNPGPAPLQNENRFTPPTGPQDLWAAIVFVAHFLAFAAIAIVSISNVDLSTLTKKGSTPSTPSNSSSSSGSTVDFSFSRTNIGSLVAGCLAGLVFSILYLVFMRRFPRQLIKGTFWLSILLYVVSAVFMLLSRNYVGAIFAFLFLIVVALVYKSYMARIPFASVVLATVSDVASKYSGTFGVTVGGLIVQLAYGAFWTLSVICVGIYFDMTNTSSSQKSSSPSGVTYVLWVFLLFSMYWTSQVIQNTIHVTVSGVFASYYFMAGSPQGMPSNPTMGALKRATTTSFGSICYGSLLIALIQTIRAMLREAMNNSDNGAAVFIACCVECLLHWIEDLAEYFNRFAYVQVAIYGKPFCRAAKDTITMLKDRGVDAIINDSLIGNVLFFGGLFVAFFSILISWLVGVIGGAELNGPQILVLIISFIFGMVVFSVISSSIDSGVVTTFVCLAEDPAALRATKPELWEKIRETYPQAAFMNMYH